MHNINNYLRIENHQLSLNNHLIFCTLYFDLYTCRSWVDKNSLSSLSLGLDLGGGSGGSSSYINLSYTLLSSGTESPSFVFSCNRVIIIIISAGLLNTPQPRTYLGLVFRIWVDLGLDFAIISIFSLIFVSWLNHTMQWLSASKSGVDKMIKYAPDLLTMYKGV